MELSKGLVDEIATRFEEYLVEKGLIDLHATPIKDVLIMKQEIRDDIVAAAQTHAALMLPLTEKV